MTSRLAIYQSSGGLYARRNVFGVDVANLGLYRALIAHGGLEQLTVLSTQQAGAQEIADVLTQGATSPPVVVSDIMNQRAAADAGALLRGRPDLHDLAWLRRRAVGDRAYSLLGLVHTIAPPTMRQMIAMSAVGPVQPWDAIICTSPSVQQALSSMLDEYGDYLGDRFGGRRGPRPDLPLLPLGVDQQAIAAGARGPGVRQALRAELGLADDDVLVLWVGRLSFFEKAFPQPMFRAAQEAAEATGARVCLALAGWFPHGETDEARYRQAAAAYAPLVDLKVLDGGDRERVMGLYGAADIFLSLVDNIQETFGLTPVEAMAAGLPVVASDWDGYRYTIRDGVEGFLIPTLGGVAGGLGHAMALRHAMGLDTYQTYVGEIAQHTAVHVGRAAAALSELIRSPALRARMGAAGRERVRTSFDWPVVVGRFKALLAHLADLRSQAPVQTGPALNPVKGDPFADFAGFATQTLKLDTILRVRPGVTADDLERARGVELDQMFGVWRGDHDECLAVLGFIAARNGAAVRTILGEFPVARRRAVELSLLWMGKLGLLDWLA